MISPPPPPPPPPPPVVVSRGLSSLTEESKKSGMTHALLHVGLKVCMSEPLIYIIYIIAPGAVDIQAIG